MPYKACRGCGGKIPKRIPGTNKKTKSHRKYCYNCSPLQESKHPPSEKAERRARKEYLIKMLGGCCDACGYDKSIRALSFHHIDPSTKKFDISSNGYLLEEWDIVIEEALKCKLLCLNCHAEFHNGK